MSTSTARPVHPPPSADPGVERRGDPFVATTAMILAGSLLGVQVLAGELSPPLAVFAAIHLVLGIVLTRSRSRWPVVLALVLAIVYVAGGVPFFVANLAHPESPASFLAEAFALIAAMTLIVGAIAGLRGVRPGGRAPIAYAAAGLAVVAVIVSVVAAAGVDADVRQPGDVAIAAERSTFPAEVEVPVGGAGLWVDNRDPIHHTLVVDGPDVRVVLPGRTAVRVELDLAPGTYRYWCDVPGHDDMEGELTVR